MRIDGRGPDQMRPLKITPDFISTAEGSVLIELGNTRVICTASVDDGVPGFLKGTGKGWVTSEYGMLPAGHRRAHTPRGHPRQTIGTHPGNSAPDRKIAPRRNRPGSHGRKNRLDRLRRDSS